MNIKFVRLVFVVILLIVGGCGGGVDEEQMEAMNNLKAEVESLRSQVKAKEDEKASLIKQISDKDAKLNKIKEELASLDAVIESFEINDEIDIPISIRSNVDAYYYKINKRKWNKLPPKLKDLSNIKRELLAEYGIINEGLVPIDFYVNQTNYIILLEYLYQFKYSLLEPKRSPNYQSKPFVITINF